MNKNIKIGIVGAGIEGIEVAKYFSNHGYNNIVVFDQNEKLDIQLPPNVKKIFGTDYLQTISECDVVFRSPGIHIGKLRNLFTEAWVKMDGLQAKSVHRSLGEDGRITSLTKYFFENCPCKIIGVTGTKGKGTTATLLYLMLKDAGFDVYLGGNIGHSPLDFLDKLTKDSVVILELSSFQLQDLAKSPSVAIVLGVTVDHLDYHKDVKEYLEAKSAIVKHQSESDIAIFNKDYVNSKYFEAITKAKKFFVSTLDSAFIGNGAHIAGSKIVYCEGAKCELIDDTAKVALLGKHNLENVLPAVIVARQLGVTISAIQKVLHSFKGLPDRLEFVCEINRVQFYNDSFSTTPETSIAGVKAFQKSVILIAGGSEKGADYTQWGLELQKSPNLKMVILIGMVADKMEYALKSAIGRELNPLVKNGNNSSMNEFPLKIYRAGSLDEAIKTASIYAIAGDVVLLSPAAASFDMFKNYKERGEKFKALVRERLASHDLPNAL